MIKKVLSLINTISFQCNNSKNKKAIQDVSKVVFNGILPFNGMSSND